VIGASQRSRSLRRAAGALIASAVVLAIGATGAFGASPVEITYEASGDGDQTWVVNSNGTGRKHLGAGQQPLVSPNGQMVAATNSGSRGHALIVYSTLGKPRQLYLNLAQTAATALAWSPDSRYIAVQVTDPTTSSISDPGAGGVSIVDTTARTVTRIAPGFVFGASFEPSPNSIDRLAYALSRSPELNSATNIYAINADGTGRAQITHDGRSLNPVWGPNGIAYDEQRLRGDNAPDYNIWLMTRDGSQRTQITHVPSGPLVEGLVPLAFSANGSRMIAELEGQDTSEGYTVSVATHSTRPIKVARHTSVNADGISQNGNALLVTLDAYENPLAEGKVAIIPFSGGHPTVLATHAGFGTWNG
jgi:Tol biopolymer transport system component